MKLRLVITGVLALLVATTVHATTLKLAPDIDLLVLDGRKISGSLLKGAEGLELEQGQHQVLFRVEKSLKKDAQMATPWVSTPLIVTFTSQAKSVTITLPPLTTTAQGKMFDKHPTFQLLNEHGAVVESQQDHLLVKADNNYEQAMVVYNLKGNVASVPRFAQGQTSTTPISNDSQDFANGNHAGSRVLQLWYQQVDSATRQRFVMLMRALRTS
ncbi:DUF2057 family protein [Erwinia billingiae]|jgi:uncharacterized protein YccT (UPF0319 family)|uniref:Conserved uncharacterized protein n=1 Tax=Erwinia billingiae (strain Eb661) TaxID=634500 RepID=D8MQH2_ERWBE|nr:MULTISPECIES: DUF2057 family protein [Erwinia]QBR51217.1 DUF2057 domain-containing protein [Erwinia sp. QL-Z3]CAX59079.1 conserved uncharacterized protein [Erwinia billingiae Eb661]